MGGLLINTVMVIVLYVITVGLLWYGVVVEASPQYVDICVQHEGVVCEWTTTLQ